MYILDYIRAYTMHHHEGPTAAAVGSAICLSLLCIFLTEL